MSKRSAEKTEGQVAKKQKLEKAASEEEAEAEGEVTIYHNPRCSKSRETLALLKDKGAAVKVVEYLKEPLNEEQLTALLAVLGKAPRDILRKAEAEYKAEKLSSTDLSDADLVAKIAEFPKLMERPIVEYAGKAVIGRPPSNIDALFD